MSSSSPCVGICILEGDVCIGCGRTTEEIFQAGVDAGMAPAPQDAGRDARATGQDTRRLAIDDDK